MIQFACPTCRAAVNLQSETTAGTFRMTVVANGPHLATRVSGYQVTDWADTRAKDANPRKGLRTDPGTIQLQAHDPMTNVEFSAIAVSEIKGSEKGK